MQLFNNIKIDWLGKRKIFYVLSVALFLIGVINVIFRGFNFGIDFKGGREIVLQYDNPIQISEIRNLVQNTSLGNLEVKTFGGETGVLLRTELQNLPSNLFPIVVANIEKEIDKIYPGLPRTIVDSTSSTVTYELPNNDTTTALVAKLFNAGYQAGKVSESLDNKQMVVNVGISEWIKENLRGKIADNNFIVVKEGYVGPKIGNELKQDATIAVFFSLIAILVYLAFRFKFIFALGAVAALFHDVLITLGLYAALYGVIPGLNLEIDLTVVAAFLTLVGYSVNDTVIVFDRVRENLKIHKTMPLIDVLNMSVNRTMSRTLLTGGTTLLTTFVLLLFGGEVLRAFAFTLFFGIIIGTYSSIFVASALVLEYAKRKDKKFQF
ncbi:MAG: protein translocase subunit SecF [Ignavibacteriales bacterium CG12_big_fil_rev_8_21_14_0_65_30_8]|nr:MAG: protein translocase subunit SecF [Ignavibacteriales bacterium CG12_big_fil_rev_8_21_14_0_65_30_8]